MSNFIQIHALTSYGPSNLNRDDLGRPKTAMMGGVERLRISSQCLKRSWRTSECFRDALGNNIGLRTKLIGKYVFDKLIEGGISEKDAIKFATEIADVFGKTTKGSLKTEQITIIGTLELEAIDNLIKKVIVEKKGPDEKDLELFADKIRAVDIAMFGRMLTSSKKYKSRQKYSVEAAVQVAHAISVNATVVEDDYFTAVDDLNTDVDTGSAHIGELGFGSAVYYIYVCVNKSLLEENLEIAPELVNTTLNSLLEAILTVSPSGKQNSFASRAYASYALIEKGSQQPRSLVSSFLAPVRGENVMKNAITTLEQQRDNMEKVYGKCADEAQSLNVETGEGSLETLKKFINA